MEKNGKGAVKQANGVTSSIVGLQGSAERIDSRNRAIVFQLGQTNTMMSAPSPELVHICLLVRSWAGLGLSCSKMK